MRFNFRKIASVLASAAMLGSTIGIAAAATTNYPTPFVTGGSADVAVVVGANAAFTDALAAGNLQTDLQAQLAKQTATSGTSTGATASGGDSANLATSSQRLYWNSTLDSARTTLSKSEMPTLLKDGTVVDDVGTSYSYTQSIVLGNTSVAYSTSSADFQDPELILDVGTAAADRLYSYRLTLNKNLNITNANVQGNTLNILGKAYTIGADSTTVGTDVLVLFSSGNEVTLKEGETTTVTVDGKEYSVTLAAVTQSGSTDKVSVSVDGSATREISEDTSSKVGGLDVYAKTVTYSAKETTTNSATLQVGAGKITLTSGSAVTKGSDATSQQGTLATLTSDGTTALLSAVRVDVAMPSSTADWIKAGGSYTDAVFGGLKVQFASVTPSLTAESRGKVTVDTDNSRNARVTFTSDRAGVEKTFSFLYDQDTSESTVTPILADTANKTIHVVENETVAVNEYTIVNGGDNGRILKLTSIPTGALDQNSYVQFEDALTGEVLKVTVGQDGDESTTWDGQTYYLRVYNGTASNVSITWGTSSAAGNAGSVISLLPRIKLKNGGWLVIAKPVFLTDNIAYSLPGAESLTTYETGATFRTGTQGLNGTNTNTSQGSWKIGNVNYTLRQFDCGYYTGCQVGSVTNNTMNATIVGIDVFNNAATNVTFNATYGGAILFIEQKKTTESGNSDNGDVIIVAADYSGSTTPVEMSVGTPQVTGSSSGLQSWSSDSYTQSAVTRYGTYAKYNSQENDKVEIFYASEQMFADVLFTADTATVNAGSSSSGGTVKEIGSVVVKDSEVSSVSDKNLVVVGGSCINTVAAKILGSDTPICGASFTEKTGIGADQFLVKVAASPYNEKKVAMLVAGYEAADTTKAVTYVKTEKPKTDAGTELKVSTTTLQTVA